MKVTDSFITLDEDVRQCQDEYTQVECRTKKYLDSIIENCKCLPFDLKLTEQVQY